MLEPDALRPRRTRIDEPSGSKRASPACGALCTLPARDGTRSRVDEQARKASKCSSSGADWKAGGPSARLLEVDLPSPFAENGEPHRLYDDVQPAPNELAATSIGEKTGEQKDDGGDDEKLLGADVLTSDGGTAPSQASLRAIIGRDMTASGKGRSGMSRRGGKVGAARSASVAPNGGLRAR